MKKLQRDEVPLRESERWFAGIFNQTLGLIRLIEPILIKGNQMALKLAEITSSKVIRRPLWRVWRL